ncbi:MBL fold metallo-hydrolase [Clostridium fallax]|uniref:Glyoxylase, beta-lactamase superfamily II n=1 Tax=Clostridium fallax TaxID=1533 RepID=A0A1M4UCE5_9CLOT|nr:MBL fold metallo-hydrolase [Clostridium fallax]SHE54344.1 Glyoxylase, beta-lactamase superfamily II [Clostridium fallax]SQB06185.1 Zn-dependent hydrolase, glyoxylase [Clostridium fallax]
MIIKRIPAGIYAANCFLLMDEDTKEMAVIDPGGDSDDIIKAIESLKGKVKFILLTHGHVDHVGGVMDIKKEYNVPFYINEEDQKLIDKGTYIYGNIPKADGYLKDGDKISLGKHTITVLETPGHTPGGVCFKVEDMVFTGDTLFKGSIGRTDLGGGDYDAIINSINNKLVPLDENTIVLPGHGPESTIAHEKQSNPFLR